MFNCWLSLVLASCCRSCLAIQCAPHAVAYQANEPQHGLTFTSIVPRAQGRQLTAAAKSLGNRPSGKRPETGAPDGWNVASMHAAHTMGSRARGGVALRLGLLDRAHLRETERVHHGHRVPNKAKGFMQGITRRREWTISTRQSSKREPKQAHRTPPDMCLTFLCPILPWAPKAQPLRRPPRKADRSSASRDSCT